MKTSKEFANHVMQTVIEQFVLEVPAIEKEMQTIGLNNPMYSNSTVVRTFKVDNISYDIFVVYEDGKYMLYVEKNVYNGEELDMENSKGYRKEIENSDFLIDGVEELLEQSK